MKVFGRFIALSALFALVVGCGGVGGISLKKPTYDALQWVQRDFTSDFRWGNHNDLQEHVAREDRAELARVIDRFSSLRITDYEIGPIELQPDGTSAMVVVAFLVYDKSFYEVQLVQVQEWNWNEERKAWLMKPSLDGIHEGKAPAL